jgi:hypothetical protein
MPDPDMNHMDRERTHETRIECPRCIVEGIVSASGDASTLMYVPHRDPAFRCLAAHGDLTEQDLVDAGVDRRVVGTADQPWWSKTV